MSFYENISECKFKTILAEFIRIGKDKFGLLVNPRPSTKSQTTDTDKEMEMETKNKTEQTVFGKPRKTNKKKRRELNTSLPELTTKNGFGILEEEMIQQETIEDKHETTAKNE